MKAADIERAYDISRQRRDLQSWLMELNASHELVTPALLMRKDDRPREFWNHIELSELKTIAADVLSVRIRELTEELEELGVELD